MRRYTILLVFIALALGDGLSTRTFAHESQPGMLNLNQLSDTRYEVVWRAPIYYGKPHPASLELPDAWKTIGEPTIRQLPDSALHRRVGYRGRVHQRQHYPLYWSGGNHHRCIRAYNTA